MNLIRISKKPFKLCQNATNSNIRIQRKLPSITHHMYAICERFQIKLGENVVSRHENSY